MLKSIRYSGKSGDQEYLLIFSSEYRRIVLLKKSLQGVERSKPIETDLFELFDQNEALIRLQKNQQFPKEMNESLPNLIMISDKFKTLLYQEDPQRGSFKFLILPVDFYIKQGEIWEIDAENNQVWKVRDVYLDCGYEKEEEIPDRFSGEEKFAI